MPSKRQVLHATLRAGLPPNPFFETEDRKKFFYLPIFQPPLLCLLIFLIAGGNQTEFFSGRSLFEQRTAILTFGLTSRTAHIEKPEN